MTRLRHLSTLGLAAAEEARRLLRLAWVAAGKARRALQ